MSTLSSTYLIRYNDFIIIFLYVNRFSNQVYGDKVKKALFPEVKSSDNDVVVDDDDGMCISFFGIFRTLLF